MPQEAILCLLGAEGSTTVTGMPLALKRRAKSAPIGPAPTTSALLVGFRLSCSTPLSTQASGSTSV
jgi:hypothetical protein